MRRFFWCLLASLGATSLIPFTGAAELPNAGTSSADCAGCHAAETELWQSSHHAQAMAASQSGNAVQGNFNNAVAEHFGLQAEFRRVDGQPVMTLIRGSQRTDHEITHSFGTTPLQQYLTAAPRSGSAQPAAASDATPTGNDKRQVLPFAWDTRPKSAGGQRWITLHPDEDILPGDRLHWQQPLANWNGMCADCHSTGFKRGFNPATGHFTSTSTEVNVACGSCHGENPHTNNAITPGSSAGFPARFPLAIPPPLTKQPDAAAHKANASRATMEICAGCHSLRAPLVDGINPNHAYLDQFTPTLLDPNLYFPDGQIREEVYVWGSFQQSKMFDQGVTCGNCHDPHSQTLKAPGNALCGQCHKASEFATQEHHNHKPASTGAQCVNCHMPARTYMVVDDRRDHSFRVPDLLASKTLGTPDACTGCHQDKDIDWAVANLKPTRNSRRGTATRQLWENNQAGMPLDATAFAKLQADSSLPAVLRASAISQQARTQPQAPVPNLATLIASSEPLVSLAAIQSTQTLPAAQRASLLAPQLSHASRAVRVAAANQLRDIAAGGGNKNPALVSALNEADAADDTSAWRGEGLMNKALNLEKSGKRDAAIAVYRRSIELEPQFEPAYINLTELYRRRGDPLQEQLLYSQALKALPDSTVLRYSYALHLIRRKNPEGALRETEKVLAIDPGNASAAYLHLLLLDNLGQTRAGVAWLTTHLEAHRNSIQVLQLGAQHAQKLQDAAAFQQFMQLLKNPSSSRAVNQGKD